MSLKIRLSRGGAKKKPFYRVVVADSRMPRDGRPYLLSNYLPERLQSSYLRWAWGHAIVCIGASGAAVALF